MTNGVASQPDQDTLGAPKRELKGRELSAHLLRSTGQAVAEKVEAAVPRRKRSAQPPPSDLEKGAPAGSRIGGDEVNMQVTDL